MKIKGFLLAGAAGVAVSPGAQAADMAVKAPAIAPAPISWTGWYIGANVGAAWQSSTASYGFNTGCCAPDTVTGTVTGFTGGGQIGYNFQSGSFVYGIEGDISGLSGKVDFGSKSGSYNSGISWLSTVRGRIGVAVGDTMPYFTAGVAAGKVKSNWNTPVNGANSPNYSDSSTRWGMAVGGGVEHMITRNISIKAEGLWVDLGSKLVNNTAPAFAAKKTTKFSNQAVIARLGLNFRY